LVLVKDKEKFAKALGSRIRNIREAKSVSLKEFEAIEPSVDRHQLSRIETGKKIPSTYTVYKIAKALKVGTDEFFSGLR
jgi:transcriptional regulator with XRE-family HTH domain